MRVISSATRSAFPSPPHESHGAAILQGGQVKGFVVYDYVRSLEIKDHYYPYLKSDGHSGGRIVAKVHADAQETLVIDDRYVVESTVAPDISDRGIHNTLDRTVGESKTRKKGAAYVERPFTSGYFSDHHNDCIIPNHTGPFIRTSSGPDWIRVARCIT
ncbi:hypothetical protein PRIPAC_91413 [Pristionchus pacificus]|uniref:Uncharacterized protein n=1 Tax=Pristionchus pacificus TaxID=54126 RepID=A0A2A6B8D3_PRIPA|nr:hypothetical protein PRIPAC_91413 [Pristionchus pacificus]|eukprot:PDM62142.1 hypothetical protein PRIPAC_51584 [Pristionchus pacificus]